MCEDVESDVTSFVAFRFVGICLVYHITCVALHYKTDFTYQLGENMMGGHIKCWLTCLYADEGNLQYFLNSLKKMS